MIKLSSLMFLLVFCGCNLKDKPIQMKNGDNPTTSLTTINDCIFLSKTGGMSFYQSEDFPNSAIENNLINEVFTSGFNRTIDKIKHPNDSTLYYSYYTFNNQSDTIGILKSETKARIMYMNISDTIFGFDRFIKPGISKSILFKYFNMKDEKNDSIYLNIPKKSIQIEFIFEDKRLKNIQFERSLSIDDF